MPRPELADLSTDELYEYVRQHPELLQDIAARDPRVKLMEEFYADPEAKKALQAHGKRLHPKASVPEVDIPAEITTSLKPHLDKIDALTKELGDLKLGERRKAFRAGLIADGAEDGDLDAIEQFMVDNEMGVKASRQAVRAFYETKATAEPNYTSETVFTMPEGGGAEHLKALLAAAPGDDLDDINAPFVDKIMQEEFGKRTRSPRPAMA